MIRKILAFFVSIPLICATLTVYAFPDLTPGTNAAEAADILQTMGVINGYTDGRFHGENILTRSEFCKMAVVVMGKEKQAAAYASYTIFPDVRSNHWAAGYINYAVRGETPRIIAGYPSGIFAPEDSVTLAQSVTILMRMLGFSEQDVGANWPFGYLSKANEIGLLDDIYLGANDTVTRLDGAVLFKNLLMCKVNSEAGKAYISTISASVIENAVLISNSAKASDGTENAVTVSGSEAKYKTHIKLPSSLVGLRGTLALDKENMVKAFIPDKSVKRQIIVSESAGTYLKAKDGEKINIPKDAMAFWGGEEKSYDKTWLSVLKNTEAIIYFSKTGSVDYILFGSGTAGGDDAKVLRYVPPSTGVNPFLSMFNVSGSEYKLYKNGSPASASDLRLYDVAVINHAAKTISVTDFKLPGVYENAQPNTATPAKIESFGIEFEVLPDAINDLQKFRIGDTFMLLLTPDNKTVAGAIATDATKFPLGILDSVAGKATVTCFNGLVLSGTPASTTMQKNTGEIVAVSSFKAGNMSAAKITPVKTGSSFDVINWKLGGADLAPDLRIFETVNGSIPVSIMPEDILTASVNSSQIWHVGYDYAKRVNLLILNNVTYDAYVYGQTYKSSVTDDAPPMIYVKNSGGETSGNAMNFSLPSIMSGAAFSSDGKVTGVAELKRAVVKRSDFEGVDYIIIGTERFKISNRVQCRIKSTEQYTDLETIKGFSEEFTVYYDRDAKSGGKIRIIETV